MIDSASIALNDAAYGLSEERWFRKMLYLVSPCHEILSINIDRNLGTLLLLRKNQTKINPASVRIPSQSYCCRLSLKE